MGRALRVAHVVQSLGHGGAEHFVVDLANAQCAAGHAVEIAEIGAAHGPAGAGAGVPVTLVRKAGRASAGTLRALTRWLREVRPHVVHTHTFTGLTYGHPAAAFARIPVVHTYHSAGAPDALYGRMQRVVDLLLRRSGAVVVFSPEQRDLLARRLRRDVEVVENGVPASLPLTDADRKALRGELGVGDEVLVLAVGGLREQKDYGLLLDAVATGVDAEVRVVGDGAERVNLERLRAALRIDSVTFVGARDDARGLLSAADVLVNTSRWESMPIAMLEAMAAGVPVVAPDVGDLRDLLDGGALVVPRTADAIAEALRTLAADPEARQRIGEAGRERVRERFSIDVTAERYTALYERLLS